MPKTSRKTDNANLPAKLALRRHFLNKFHAGKRPYVMDCCMGSGVIWSDLRGEGFGFDYWGVDEKPKKGRLKIDSIRILQQPGWPQTVVDVDTYGSPWKHWLALLPNVSQPTTVFLTIGQMLNQAAMSDEEAIALGIKPLNVPNSIKGRLALALSIPYMLAAASRTSLDIVEAKEATRGPRARYIGVHLRPKESACTS